jgi:energy-coupling factor transporter transmembrane protein EcfT
MSGKDEPINGDVSSTNILRITDELVRQVDQTKKLVAIMLLVIVVAIPVSWHLAPLVTASSPDSFRIAGYVTIVVAIIFVGIGVRQWLQLSKWTRKYKLYKELQNKVDAKLDFEGTNGTQS